MGGLLASAWERWKVIARAIGNVQARLLLSGLTGEEKLFDGHDPGTRFDHLFCQLGWMFTRGHEGGLFIMIGKKVR